MTQSITQRAPAFPVAAPASLSSLESGFPTFDEDRQGAAAAASAPSSAVQSLMDDFQAIGAEILGLVIDVVQASEKPVPIAYLADRAQKILGHAKTLGTNWAGSGGFLNFLNSTLPENIKLTDKPPHFVYDPRRHRTEEQAAAAQPAQRLQRQPIATRRNWRSCSIPSPGFTKPQSASASAKRIPASVHVDRNRSS